MLTDPLLRSMATHIVQAKPIHTMVEGRQRVAGRQAHGNNRARSTVVENIGPVHSKVNSRADSRVQTLDRQRILLHHQLRLQLTPR